MKDIEVSKKIEYIEELFLKYGAIPAKFTREDLNEQTVYTINGSFFRAGTAEFDGKTFLLISNIDDPEFAALGIMEDIDILPCDLDAAKLEKAVRYAFGVEPYPEKYPEF